MSKKVDGETKEKSKFDIKPLKTAKSDIPQIQAAKDGTIMKYPFSCIIAGPSGGGKTVLCLNLLLNPNLYKDFFHSILVCSPTANDYDDTWKALKLHKDNFIKDFSPETLNKIIELRKKQIKSKGIKWVSENSRMLIILDDIIANRDFLQSEECVILFALLRHYLCSIIILVQKFNAVNRTCRINTNAVMTFCSTHNELECLKDELCPPGLSKKEFEKMINYATEGKHDFLFINNHAPKNEKFRKNLTEILNLNNFKN